MQLWVKSKKIFFRPSIEWTNTFRYAFDLSKNHTKNIGTRSLDVLHVASALSIKSDKFITFDDRQSELASLAGLQTIKIFD